MGNTLQTIKQAVLLLMLLVIISTTASAQYNGTATGGALTHTTGAHGLGLQGTGSSPNYMTIPVGAVNFSGDFSVSMKINVPSVDGFRDFYESTNAAMGYYWGGIVYCVIGGTTIASSGVDITTLSFPEVSCRRAGTTGSIWVNGVQRGSATVSTGNLGTGPAQLLASATSGGFVPTSTVVDEVSIWRTATPSACNPCAGTEPGLNALYHLNGDLIDSAVAGTALSAGTLVNAVGLEYSGFAGGTGTGTVQLQSYLGACSSGTYLTDGVALTGQAAGTLQRFARGATVRCYRVQVVVGAETANTAGITAPAAGGGSGGMRSQ